MVDEPVTVIFGGPPLDPPGSAPPCFPRYLESAVKAAIAERLAAVGANVGYSCAGAGADLLFVEAMLRRRGEVHLFLPFALEDFVRVRVAPAGADWIERFHAALDCATSVSYATQEPYLGHRVLFRFNNQMIQGLARLRGQLLGRPPRLLLVWDYAAAAEAGTAADLMDHWPEIATLQLIDLDELRASGPPSPVSAPSGSLGPPESVHHPERVIRSLLFADIVGFSKLGEEHLPRLWELLTELRAAADRETTEPELVESWGDALYVAMASARAMLAYAFALDGTLATSDWPAHGLPRPLQMRIGLHAGPVYTAHNPLTGRTNVFGSHVNRAARIEPVTVPGQIYASEQFVALLTAEEDAYRHQQLMTGGPYAPWYQCEALGNLSLAKGYGDQVVYRLWR